MKNYSRLTEALKIICIKEPNVFFIGGDVTQDYLLFFEGYVKKNQRESLEKLGAVFVAKYDSWGFEREYLWDNRN